MYSVVSSLPMLLLLLWFTIVPLSASAADVEPTGIPESGAETAAVPEPLPAAFPVSADPQPGGTAAPVPDRPQPEPAAIPADIPAPSVRLVVPEVRPSVAHVAMGTEMTMLVDDGGRLGIDEAVSRLGGFVPYDASAFLRRNGALWLHYPLAATGESAPHTLWLDLGTQLPPRAEVWLSTDGRSWKSATPAMHGVYSLRSAGPHGQVLLRLDGMPGLWFHPVLIPLPSVLDSLERQLHGMIFAVFGAVALLSLLLGLSGRGETRFWCFLLAAAAAVQGIWAVPSSASGLGVTALPGIFAAGIALVIFPHLGRVLMHTRENSPAADIFFLFLALPGACAALLPLLPGMAWTARLLVLWPLASLLCLLPALFLLFRGISGSGSFVLACLAMGGGALVAVWALPRGMEASLWGQAVLAGPALGLIFLTAASSRKEQEPTPSLSLIDASLPSSSDVVDEEETEEGLQEWRRRLKRAVEELLDESCRLDQALSRAGLDASKMDIMSHADGMVAIVRRLSEKLTGHQPDEELPESADTPFELREVIQVAFASVSAEAEKKGLGLSWYVAPYLGRRYRGDSTRLAAILSLLLADSVRASSRGAVSLRVRRSPNSTHPGHLLFSVADSGEGQPPHGRSSTLMARVWEFAVSCGGEVSVSSGADGTVLTFGMACTAYEDDGTTVRPVPDMPEEALPRDGRVAIIASSDRLERHMLAYYLEGLELTLWEARDAAEAVGLYRHFPASLVLLDGSLLDEDMAQAVASIRMYEGERDLPAVPFLLLARDDLQAERMSKAGCDEALLPPLIRKDLRAMVKWLLAPAGTAPRPVLTSQRVTLAAVLAGARSGSWRLQRKGDMTALRGGPNQDRTEKVLSESVIAEGSVEQVEQKAPEEIPAAEPRKGWFSSLFRSSGKTSETLTLKGYGAEDDAQATGPVVDLSAEQVLDEESGVHVLTDEERVPDSTDCPELPEENGDRLTDEVPSDLQDVRAESSEGEEAVEDAEPVAEPTEPEELEEPLDRIYPVLELLANALNCLDAPSIRRGSSELARIADGYGMHTLADMARCLRAAWEEGDVDAARQIVDEIRAEAARK